MDEEGVPVTYNGVVVGVAHIKDDGTASIEIDETFSTEHGLLQKESVLSYSIYDPKETE